MAGVCGRWYNSICQLLLREPRHPLLSTKPDSLCHHQKMTLYMVFVRWSFYTLFYISAKTIERITITFIIWIAWEHSNPTKTSFNIHRNPMIPSPLPFTIKAIKTTEITDDITTFGTFDNHINFAFILGIFNLDGCANSHCWLSFNSFP